MSHLKPVKTPPKETPARVRILGHVLRNGILVAEEMEATLSTEPVNIPFSTMRPIRVENLEPKETTVTALIGGVLPVVGGGDG